MHTLLRSVTRAAATSTGLWAAVSASLTLAACSKTTNALTFIGSVKAVSSSSFHKTTATTARHRSMLHAAAAAASSTTSSLPTPDPITVPPGGASSPTPTIEIQTPVTNPIDETCVVLIVGASRGIGLEFVRQCLERNATVVATHRSSSVPSSLEELRTIHGGDKVVTLEMDLTSESSIVTAAQTLSSSTQQQQQQGSTTTRLRLTHIVHNAGIYLPETSFDGTSRSTSRAAAPKVTKDAMMQTFEINAVAPLLVAQNFVPLLHKRSETTYPILGILGSKVGSVDDNGSGGAYAYRASKCALNNIAKSLSIDLMDEARVVLLHPGYVQTDMTNGKGLITARESVEGMIRALECTDVNKAFRFVDYKACLIPW